jgi:hypothetical protein
MVGVADVDELDPRAARSELSAALAAVVDRDVRVAARGEQPYRRNGGEVAGVRSTRSNAAASRPRGLVNAVMARLVNSSDGLLGLGQVRPSIAWP